MDEVELKKRLDRLDNRFGEDFADAVSNSLDLLDISDLTADEATAKSYDIFLAILFAMPLPEVGAADHLIAHIQSLRNQINIDF